jgi:hypothetical protein
MPCRDYDDDRNTPGSAYQESQITLFKNRADDAARAACVAFNAIERIARNKGVPPLDLITESTKPCKTYKEVVDAFKWWGVHKAADDAECAKRAEKFQMEQDKKVALGKLTKAERRALQELGL